MPRRPRVRACCWFALVFLVPLFQKRWQKHETAPPHSEGSGCGKKTARSGPERAGKGRGPDRIPAEAAAGVGRQQQRKGQGGREEAPGGREEAPGRQEGAPGGRAEVRGQSKRPGRTSAGRGACALQSLLLPLVCTLHGRRGFSCVPPFLLFGVLLSSQDLLVVKLSSLCWLAALRGAGSLAASGSGKSGCSSCFADASERGVSPRLEVRGVSLFCVRFALALRSLSRLRLFLSEARLSGFCVREGESRDRFLVLLARGP